MGPSLGLRGVLRGRGCATALLALGLTPSFFFFTVSSLSLLGNILEFGDLGLK